MNKIRKAKIKQNFNRMLSTGLLPKDRAVTYAHVVIYNRSYFSRSVRVIVLGWVTGKAPKILQNSIITTPPNRERDFYFIVDEPDSPFFSHYEVRLLVNSTERSDLLINVFGTDNLKNPFPFASNRVLNQELTNLPYQALRPLQKAKNRKYRKKK